MAGIGIGLKGKGDLRLLKESPCLAFNGENICVVCVYVVDFFGSGVSLCCEEVGDVRCYSVFGALL